MRIGPVLSLLLLAGCGVAEIRTPRTEGRPPERLARLRVAAHHDGLRKSSSPTHLRTLVIDGAPYAVESEATDFWLPPGEHRVSARYEDCIHGPTAGPRSATEAFVNGSNSAFFTAEAGRSYELTFVITWNSGPWVILVFKPL